MAKKDNMQSRIESEQQAIVRVTNDDLTCWNCVFAFDDSKKMGNTSKCEKYSMKPSEIVAGGECELKVEKA